MNRYNKQIMMATVVAGLMAAANGAGAHEEEQKAPQKGVYEGTVHGVISDSMCKFDHTAMIKAGHGKDAASCTKKCVGEGNKLVLADKKDNIVYTFSNSKKAEPFAGKSVAVSGHIDPQTKVIHIHEIKSE